MTSSLFYEFVEKSSKYSETLHANKLINQVIKSKLKDKCEFCNKNLTDWPFKTKKSFFISLGHLSLVDIPLKVCKKCKRVFSPGTVILNLTVAPLSPIFFQKKNWFDAQYFRISRVRNCYYPQ